MRSPVPKGVLAPLTTPFDRHGEIDDAAFRAEIEWLLACGVDGVVVGGSTGEGYALSPAEIERLVAMAIEVVPRGTGVVAGIIADSTREAVAVAGSLSRYPLAAVQVTPPHYIFTPNDDEMVDFYTAMASSGPAPVIIYNVIPWLQLAPALIARIFDAHAGVVAVKHSRKSIDAYRELVGCVGAERVIAAIDNQLAECYAIGATGSIAAITAAAPAESARLFKAVHAGDPVAEPIAAFLADLWKVVGGANLPARVKAAQMIQGLPASHVRAPMRDASEAEQAAIAGVLRQWSAGQDALRSG